jgi:uncharacterized protein (TIGR00255 family)
MAVQVAHFTMTLASMTGFARAAGTAGPWRLAWELKAVNAKGLDARLRLSPPFDAIEPDARAKLAQKLTRGTIQAAFTAQRETTTPKFASTRIRCENSSRRSPSRCRQ